jgi:Protein of unknown function (DUF2809)
MRRGLRAAYLGLALATIVAGLILRLVPLGLPFFVTKYGGSVLWAAMVYLLLAGLWPRREPWVLGLIACVFATLVELSRLYHTPGLDAFRLTLAGALLLGRVFSRWHFPIYWIAIALTAELDVMARRRVQGKLKDA